MGGVGRVGRAPLFPFAVHRTCSRRERAACSDVQGQRAWTSTHVSVACWLKPRWTFMRHARSLCFSSFAGQSPHLCLRSVQADWAGREWMFDVVANKRNGACTRVCACERHALVKCLLASMAVERPLATSACQIARQSRPCSSRTRAYWNSPRTSRP